MVWLPFYRRFAGDQPLPQLRWGHSVTIRAHNFHMLLFCVAICTVGCQPQSADTSSPVAVAPASAREEVPPIDMAGHRPIEVVRAGYTGSQGCVDCHPDEHASWSASYHRTMTQLVAPETVVGRFAGQELNFYGWSFRPYQRGDEFWLDIRGGSQSEHYRHKFVMMTGSHHMQKYWYSTGTGRELGISPLVYLIEAELWVPEHTAFLRPTEAGLPIREGNWNKGCNQCHATASQPRLFGPDDIDTHVVEFGISCEACHGPGAEHARAMTELQAQDAASPHSLAIVNPRKLPAARSADVCGQCHGAWVMKNVGSWATTGHVFRPGDDLSQTRHYLRGSRDEHLLEHVQAEDSFWPDGEIRVAGREYNGLLASACFAHDQGDADRMTCLSCHDLHAITLQSEPLATWANDQLGHAMDGNEACLGCHEAFREQLVKHTHHAPDSAGSQCYNCHMPYTSYGLLKAVRSHTISSPSVATSLSTGRPNACNQCHLDQTLQWSATHLKSWYGHKIPPLQQEEQSVAAAILWTLKGDAAQRALMAWSYGWDRAREVAGSDWIVLYLTDLMLDDYDAIRFIAARSLRSIPGFETLEYDHMHPEQQQQRVMDEVMARWQAKITLPPTDTKLLFDVQGNVRMDLYRSLRERRDNRKVVVTE